MTNSTAFVVGLIILLSVGAFLPYFEDAFGSDETHTNTFRDFEDSQNPQSSEWVEGATGTASATMSGWRIVWNMFKMLFWTFGTLPFWMDAIIFIPIRIFVLSHLIKLLPTT